MGKNTPERQDFIIENLKVEIDELSDEEKEEQAILEAEVAEV